MQRMPPTACSSVGNLGTTTMASPRTGSDTRSQNFSPHNSAPTSDIGSGTNISSKVNSAEFGPHGGKGGTPFPPGGANSTKFSKKSTNNGGNKNARGTGKKSVYKHVPHALKPVHLVAKRNARERRRVQAVNSAFIRLRKHVPYEPRHKRLSKVKTLRVAITYISHLQDLIREHDRRVAARGAHSHPQHHPHHTHLHHHHHHHSLNILADAAATTSYVAPTMNCSDNPGVSSYDDFHFLEGHMGDGDGGSQLRSGHMQGHGHGSLHVQHGRHGSLTPGGVMDMPGGTWVDGVPYTNPTDDGNKSAMPACSSESSLYFVSPPCQPSPFDSPSSAGYMPNFENYSIQSPYPLMR